MTRRFAVLLVPLVVIGTIADRARAAEPDAASIEEAKRLYGEAHGHFVAGRCDDAMPLLVRSNRLVPSPNSGLLIARCLAVANKQVEAATLYGEVERDALNQIRSGETRYAETAAAAAKEGAALRSKLGTLRVRLLPRAGVALEIDGAPKEIQSEGETVLLHEPGTAKVTFVLPAARRERGVTITAGKESLVVYEPEPTRPAPVPTPWTVYAAGGGAVLGFAGFAVFGLASESTYGDLEERCGPRCGSGDQADADRGRTFQTIANVSLVVGGVFAIATAVLLATR